MAWRFNYSAWVKGGFLENTVPNKITGELELAGIGIVPLDLLYDSVVDDINIKGKKPTLDEFTRITLGAFQGKKVSFQNPHYDPKSLDHGLGAVEDLADYALWDEQCRVDPNKRSRGIVGLIRGVYIDPELQEPMSIEFFNTRTSGGFLVDRSVIESVKYSVE